MESKSQLLLLLAGVGVCENISIPLVLDMDEYTHGECEEVMKYRFKISRTELGILNSNEEF